MQEAIAEADRTGDYSASACQAATDEFMLLLRRAGIVGILKQVLKSLRNKNTSFISF